MHAVVTLLVQMVAHALKTTVYYQEGKKKKEKRKREKERKKSPTLLTLKD